MVLGSGALCSALFSYFLIGDEGPSAVVVGSSDVTLHSCKDTTRIESKFACMGSQQEWAPYEQWAQQDDNFIAVH